jgi:hypothetical protein
VSRAGERTDGTEHQSPAWTTSKHVIPLRGK